MTSLLDILAVGAGGALGAAGRYVLGLIPIHSRNGFPIITLVINVAGAFCIGLLAALAAKSSRLDPRLLLFLKVGICGGFTTFSTFSLESAALLQNGHTFMGATYILLSVILGICAIFGAQVLSHSL